jgi:hypothetical protein
VLNEAFPESHIPYFDDAVKAWDWAHTSEDGELSFTSACDALAAAVKAGLIPPQGMDVLRSLVTTSDLSKVAVSEQLKELLIASDGVAKCDEPLDVPDEDCDTSVGSGEVSDDKELSPQKTLVLTLVDLVDASKLPTDFPLHDMWLGTEGTNSAKEIRESLKAVSDESGVEITLDDVCDQLEFLLSVSNGDVPSS